MRLKRAVFPVAGFGTRMLPATKAIPKEMITLIDKPLIQYAVEEAIDSGIEQIIFVTGRTKKALEDHFDINIELNNELAKSGNQKMLAEMKKISEMINLVYVRQKEMLGLGNAILCVKDIVKDDPFVVILPDDIILSKQPVVSQLIEKFEQYNSPIISTMNVDTAHTNKYGIIKVKESIDDRLSLLDSLVEKPKSNPPSNEAIIGRYVLTSEVMTALEEISTGANSELQLTDALNHVAKHSNVYGYKFEGKRFDCGTCSGLLEATINFANSRADLQSDLKRIIMNL